MHTLLSLPRIQLILLVQLGALVLPTGARAEEPSPTAPASETIPATPAPAEADSEAAEPVVADSDAAMLAKALEDENTIVVWGARERRAFDRDTPLRLTGEELRKRGVGNVAEALDLLPEVYVRAAGRGGRQIDVRGARKGSVKILLDGISIGDPYYGNIDLSAIPITDIEQIRVSAAPASPIDGPGGPGGVIEIITTDAIGKRSVRARMTGGSVPSAEASATGRATLAPGLAARVSASVVLGGNDYEFIQDGQSTFLSEDKQQSVGAVRIEYRKGERRFVTDIWTQQVAFVAPPARDGTMNILAIKGETQGRLGLGYDDSVLGTRIAGRAHFHLLRRDSTYYEDPELRMVAQDESLAADRSGLSLLANRPIGKSLFVIGSANLESDHAQVDGFDGQRTEGRATIVQAATELQYKGDRLAARAAGGVAVPLGLSADPWPEFKLSVSYQPAKAVELRATAGHKGRTPTLRERYRLDIGNKSLGPEKALFAELGTMVRPISELKLGLSGYARKTNGLIRFDSEQRALINTEDLDILGLEATFEAELGGGLRSGASYSYSTANSELLGPDPLDFFPEHRATTWLGATRGRFGVTARLQYFGSQIDRGTTLVPRYLGQLTGRAQVSEHYLLTLRAENISGQVYEQRVGVLAPGRTAFLSLQAEW